MKGKDGTEQERINDKKDAEYVKVIRTEDISRRKQSVIWEKIKINDEERKKRDGN